MIDVNKVLWFVAVFRHNSERVQKKQERPLKQYPSIVHRLRECIGNYMHQVLLLAISLVGAAQQKLTRKFT